MREWEDLELEHSKKDDNNNLILWVHRVASNWYWFALSAILGVGLAVSYLELATPIYLIKAKVLVNDEKKGASTLGDAGMLSDLSGLLGTKSTVDNEAEILKTRTLMEQVVRSLDAHITYYQKDGLTTQELYQAPFRVITLDLADTLEPAEFRLTAIGGEVVSISGEHIQDTISYDTPIEIPFTGRIIISRNHLVPLDFDSYQFTVNSIDNQVADYMERLTVVVTNKLVTVIDLSFEYPLKTKGENIVHTLIEKYVQGNLQDKNTIADSTIAFIENRLLFVGEELDDVEGDIQTFKQRSQLADIATQSQLLLENTSNYVNELAKVETKLNILNSMEGYLKESTSRVLPNAIVPEDLVFSELIQRYNILLLERDRQSLSATPDNPYIQNLEEQIANLRQDMLINLQSNKRNLNIAKADLQGKTLQLEGEIKDVPATERTYLDLARQQQIKQELYLFLLQKREETAIGKTSNISNSRVIDVPKAEPQPISPNKMITLGFGLASGLLIPFLIIYLRDVLNTRIMTKEDITRRTGVPIIAEISHNDTKYTLLVRQDSRLPITEQFRSLRTNLGFYLKEPNQKTVLLTSSMSGEGKSFVALNLAMVMAISGKKVVVMEMDLRKPNLSTKLEIKNTFGFSNYIISRDINPLDIVVPSGIHHNLSLISSGPIPPNPAELLLSDRTGELFATLNDNFDYVIVDAPPIGLVTDAQLLSPFTDITLYLVRQRYTHKSQLALPNELFTEKRIPKLSILVNDIHSNYRYGYGYGYMNEYGYGKYDVQAIEKKRWWPFEKKHN